MTRCCCSYTRAAVTSAFAKCGRTLFLFITDTTALGKHLLIISYQAQQRTANSSNISCWIRGRINKVTFDPTEQEHAPRLHKASQGSRSIPTEQLTWPQSSWYPCCGLAADMAPTPPSFARGARVVSGCTHSRALLPTCLHRNHAVVVLMPHTAA